MSESLKVLQRIDFELFRLINLKTLLLSYEYVGCDVKEYLDYINQKIDEVGNARLVNYKMYLIELGELPIICFSDCLCDCLNCERIREYYECES